MIVISKAPHLSDKDEHTALYKLDKNVDKNVDAKFRK